MFDHELSFPDWVGVEVFSEFLATEHNHRIVIIPRILIYFSSSSSVSYQPQQYIFISQRNPPSLFVVRKWWVVLCCSVLHSDYSWKWNAILPDITKFLCSTISRNINQTALLLSLVLTNSISLFMALQYSLLQTASETCQKKRHCKFTASARAFGGDPCPGVKKFVEVAFKCRPCK